MLPFDSETRTYYNVLDVSAQASQEAIREAYQRAKNAFDADSMASYSLMGSSETEGLLKELEEAFLVLSSPDQRKAYDQRLGLTGPSGAKIVSIDRTPPMSPEFTEQYQTESEWMSPVTDTKDPEERPAEESLAVSEWSGETIRNHRELKRISLEEISEYTKIGKNHLRAIENEDFNKLPAPVFLRGFLIQLCRFLKLPPDHVISSYLNRYQRGKKPD